MSGDAVVLTNDQRMAQLIQDKCGAIPTLAYIWLDQIAKGQSVCLPAEEVYALRDFVDLFESFDGLAMDASQNPTVTEKANRLLGVIRQSAAYKARAEEVARLREDAERYRILAESALVLSPSATTSMTSDRHYWRAQVSGYNGIIYAASVRELADRMIEARAVVDAQS